MKRIFPLVAVLLALAGCASPPRQAAATFDRISSEVAQAAAQPRHPAPAKDDIGLAMLPPLQLDLSAVTKKVEPRFDLEISNTPAARVFMALVADTQYSVLLPPELSGNLSLKLKSVTLREALDTIRELYGYEYKVQGSRIFIQSNTLQSRVFQVNYLASRRQGTSDLTVTSSGGSMQGGGSGAYGATAAAYPGAMTGSPLGGNYSAGGSAMTGSTASRVQTSSEVDFWKNLENALNAIVGSSAGAGVSPGPAGAAPLSPTLSPGVIVNTVSGIIVIRALPREMRLVENYLKATQAVVERQVMLEAKILEVSLSQGFQSGVNWSAFGSGPNSNLALGVAAPGSTLKPLTRATAGTPVVAGVAGSTTSNTVNTYVGTNLVSTTTTTTTTPAVDGVAAVAGSAAAAQALIAGNTTITPGLAGSMVATALGKGFVGLAFQTANFASLLNFLETQGNVQVLSSPRIATLNNQKAVLKVGTDEVYITGFTVAASNTVGTATTTTSAVPTPTTATLFSGISLDVMPQIDDEGNIVLHVHPAVSKVSETQKTFNLGTAGSITLPLASRNVNETDSIVRVRDGNIVAIGGLMSQDQSMDRSGLPGTTGSAAGALVGQRGASLNKRELVILLKPTVIVSDGNWVKDLAETSERLQRYDPRSMLGEER